MPHTVSCSPGRPTLYKTSQQTRVLIKTDTDTINIALATKKDERLKMELVWINIIMFGFLHLAAIYGGYLFFVKAKWATVLFCKIFVNIFHFNYNKWNFTFSNFLVFYWCFGYYSRCSSFMVPSFLQS